MQSIVWGGIDYPVTQPFLPGPPAVHCGIDIGMPSGTIIHAARSGVVERVQTGMVGVHVAGSTQRDFYLHGFSLCVVGQAVIRGAPMCHSDTVPVDPRYPPTGPHLHFEVQDGYTLPGAPPWAPGHPLDPVPILLGVATVGEQPWTTQGELQAWLTDVRKTQAAEVGTDSTSVLPATLPQILTAVKAIPVASNQPVLDAISNMQGDVTAIKNQLAALCKHLGLGVP